MKFHQFLFWFITLICTTAFILNSFGTIQSYFDDSIIISTQHRFDLKSVKYPSLTVCYKNSIFRSYPIIDIKYFKIETDSFGLVLSEQYFKSDPNHLRVLVIRGKRVRCHTIDFDKLVNTDTKYIGIRLIKETSMTAYIHEKGQQFRIFNLKYNLLNYHSFTKLKNSPSSFHHIRQIQYKSMSSSTQPCQHGVDFKDYYYCILRENMKIIKGNYCNFVPMA